MYIGKVAVGGNCPVSVQSMTTTSTLDTESTVKQIKDLAVAGCDFVRVTTQNVKEAQNLVHIKSSLKKLGINIPIIADVHYNPKVAEIAAKFTDKVRINPGNYINNSKVYTVVSTDDDKNEVREIENNIIPLLKICAKYKTAIRIGVNHGSLSNRILYKYGNTALGMVESILEFANVCYRNEFHNIVLSLKASNVITMIEANMLLVEKMKEKGYSYPIHLGVTEAGCDEDGRIKSAAGIGYLLAHGIGDTIRVSLSENPIEEIPVALKIVEYYGHSNIKTEVIKHNEIKFPSEVTKITPPVVITTFESELSDYSISNKYSLKSQSHNSIKLNIYKFCYAGIPYLDLIIRASVDATIAFLTEETEGIWIDNDVAVSSDRLAKLALNILQILGLRITKTEFVACPTCGRASINVINQLKEVKEKTSHLAGLKIAIMGCAVNGPGEMADAHYGYVGLGKGKVNIYKGKNIVYKNVSQKKAIDTLICLIKENGDWKDV